MKRYDQRQQQVNSKYLNSNLAHKALLSKDMSRSLSLNDLIDDINNPSTQNESNYSKLQEIESKMNALSCLNGGKNQQNSCQNLNKIEAVCAIKISKLNQTILIHNN